MTRPAIVARQELSIESVAELMLSNGLSRIPIVDDRQKLVGIISKTDLLTEHFDRPDDDAEWSPELARIWRAGVPLAEQGIHLHDPEATIAQVMRPAPVSVTEETTIAEAAHLMAFHRLHGLPVLAPDGRVAGMVSLLDIAGWLAGLH